MYFVKFAFNQMACEKNGSESVTVAVVAVSIRFVTAQLARKRRYVAILSRVTPIILGSND